MRVLFTSEHDLERAENLRAVYEAYDGDKTFAQGIWHMSTAPQDGYKAVVCDSLPAYMPDKGECKSIVINHSILSGKVYALDEKRSGIDARALSQIDCAVNASTKTVETTARMFGIPLENVYALGMPRTDAYIGKAKGDGGTFLSEKKAYLYAPTFRGRNDGDRLPRLDWRKLDEMLSDDELLVCKRHYFTSENLVEGNHAHIVELDKDIASGPYVTDCDVLITDYSTILFDGYLAGKPSVLAVDDYECYKRTRGMYLDYPSQYGSRWITAEGNEEALLDVIRDAYASGMGETERECIDLVADMCDGESTERVCEMIGALCES